MIEKRNNTIYHIALRLLVVFLVFTACRGIFLAQNSVFYPDMNFCSALLLMLNGMRYDLMLIFFINTPYIVLELMNISLKNKILAVITKTLFVAVNLFAIIFNIIDIFYFAYTLDRLTFDFFYYLTTQKNLEILLYRFAGDYWYGFLAFILFIFLIFKGYSKIGTLKLKNITKKNSRRIPAIFVIIWILIAQIAIFSVTKNKSKSYKGDALYLSALINTPYNTLMNWFDPVETSLIRTIEPTTYFPTDSLAMDKKNVVIFILESFAKEGSAFLNPDMYPNQKGYMPFLDSLMSQSYCFTNAYANGRRSMDAVPALLASQPVTLYPKHTNSKNSLPYRLKEEGYTLQFFHGAHNGSMDFDKYCKTLGINNYYGMTEYNNDSDFDDTWGIWDEPFLQYMADIQKKTKEPFFSTIFNLSSHNPYIVPEKYKNQFKEGIAPICKCISYADYAIKQYFKTASKMSWFKNTIFVFSADHAIIPWHKSYATSQKSFAIPLFIYTPDGSLQGKSSDIAQQADIMPTILNLLHYPQKYSVVGNDLFNKKQQKWAVTNILKVPQVIKE